MNQNIPQGEEKKSLSSLSPLEPDDVLDYICQLEKEVEELVLEKV